ncbi:MAG: hypothetical protein ABTD50_06660 [Polyangiaceae bacterium]|jgi:hypothetical protein
MSLINLGPVLNEGEGTFNCGACLTNGPWQLTLQSNGCLKILYLGGFRSDYTSNVPCPSDDKPNICSIFGGVIWLQGVSGNNYAYSSNIQTVPGSCLALTSNGHAQILLPGGGAAVWDNGLFTATGASASPGAPQARLVESKEIRVQAELDGSVVEYSRRITMKTGGAADVE